MWFTCSIYLSFHVSPSEKRCWHIWGECLNRFFEFLLSRTNLFLHEIRLGCASRTAYSFASCAFCNYRSFIYKTICKPQARRHVDECFVTPYTYRTGPVITHLHSFQCRTPRSAEATSPIDIPHSISSIYRPFL